MISPGKTISDSQSHSTDLPPGPTFLQRSKQCRCTSRTRIILELPSTRQQFLSFITLYSETNGLSGGRQVDDRWTTGCRVHSIGYQAIGAGLGIYSNNEFESAETVSCGSLAGAG